MQQQGKVRTIATRWKKQKSRDLSLELDGRREAEASVYHVQWRNQDS